uniref:C-type lectin domain-containing protein n=1 Tax=Oryzias latipes TaxID=8090 RepID=A0A3P9I6J1_ORYLA
MLRGWEAGGFLLKSITISLVFSTLSSRWFNPEYVFVNERMNWSSAQRHCRQNFKDLATVRNDTDWQKIYSVVPTNQYLWTGLYRDSNISWSDGSNFSIFQTPLNVLLQPGVISARCGYQYGQNRNHWYFYPCENRYPFICYGPKGEFSITFF